MTSSNILNLAVDLPRLFILQAAQPFRLCNRRPATHPKTAQELADLVNHSLKHEIRAGFTHRFIPLMFVTVGDRVFARRYRYEEPSWHSAFRANPPGQIRLDKTIIKIEGKEPCDLEEIIPKVDQAYADQLKKRGARFLLGGATNPRAQQSTIELTLPKSAHE